MCSLKIVRWWAGFKRGTCEGKGLFLLCCSFDIQYCFLRHNGRIHEYMNMPVSRAKGCDVLKIGLGGLECGVVLGWFDWLL